MSAVVRAEDLPFFWAFVTVGEVIYRMPDYGYGLVKVASLPDSTVNSPGWLGLYLKCCARNAEFKTAIGQEKPIQALIYRP